MIYYHCMLKNIHCSNLKSINKNYVCNEYWSSLNNCFDTEQKFLKNFKNKKYIYHSLSRIKFCEKCLQKILNNIEYL